MFISKESTVKTSAQDFGLTTVSLRKNSKLTQSDKYMQLCAYIEENRKRGLTGHIKVNFNQGNICKVEKYEEVLRD